MRAGLRAAAFALALVVAVQPAAARATTVLSELPPADVFSAGTLFSDLQHPREAASIVVLPQAAQVERIVWWGGYFSFEDPPSPGSSAFEIRLYADEGAGPLATPFFVASVTATVTPFPAALPQFEYAVTLDAPVTLDANVVYWIAIVDVDPLHPTFAWRKSTEAGSSWSRVPDDLAWTPTDGMGSVRLEGQFVPEPGTALLTALGLAGLAAARREPGAR